MKPATLVLKLRHFVVCGGYGMGDEYGHADYSPSRGETVLASMLANYIADRSADLAIPAVEADDLDDRRKAEDWLLGLPDLLVSAFEAFRTEPGFADGRRAYASETDGRDILDLVDAHAGGIHRLLVVHGMARMMSVFSGEPWLRGAIEYRLNVQMRAIGDAWWRFVGVAYAPLIRRIKSERHRGNSGVFGATTLMTWAGIGRVMVTFSGPDGHVTYVADENDPTGERSGPNSPGAPWRSCVDMINEVTNNWDMDKLAPDRGVGPL